MSDHDASDGWCHVTDAHRHILTLRLILANLTELTDDGDEVDIDIDTDRDIIVAEVDDCPDCWRAIATRAVMFAAAYACYSHGRDIDKAIADIESQIAVNLDLDGRRP